MAEASTVLPFAVNFFVVVVLLAVLLRKPLRRYVYQRHGHIKDFVDASAKDLAEARARERVAEDSLRGAEREVTALLDREREAAACEAAELVAAGAGEAGRIKREADALVVAIQAESEERMRSAFVDEIVLSASSGLRAGLRGDDHRAIIRQAEISIGAGL